jgi:hypothetical protein
MIVSTPTSNAEGFTMLRLFILADSVHDWGHYLKELPEQRSIPRPTPGFFESGMIKSSEVNRIARNQINIGPQRWNAGENVKSFPLSQMRGVFEVTDCTVNFADDQINVRRPEA